MNRFLVTFLFLFCIEFSLYAQCSIEGYVIDVENDSPIPNAHLDLGDGTIVTSNSEGFFQFEDVNAGVYTIEASFIGYKTLRKKLELKVERLILNFKLEQDALLLNQVDLSDVKDAKQNIIRLNSIEGTAIYASKKNEVILMEQSMANKATNNSRQVYAKVPGLNIWESDGLGMQLEIGARGLSPHRTSNFNTRQNGYDISADALGYPESYYTPPSEAIKKIQLVRGAASLQYGTQFGGLLNFVLKDGAEKPIELNVRQSVGSFGLANTFISIGGSKSKLRYYSFVQKKSRKGWRDNSEIDAQTFFGFVKYKANQKLQLALEFTHMHYLSQQAGGLNDFLFVTKPDTSLRSRNWFRVNWNIGAFVLDYKFSNRTSLNSRTFGLWASRDALGILDNQYVVDSVIMEVKPNRDLLLSSFENYGNETRLIHRYLLADRESALLIGTRFYKGNTIKEQGNASASAKADFTFENKLDHYGTHFKFPSSNYALFAENLFRLNDEISVTPGFRYDKISTKSDGYFHALVDDSVHYTASEKRLDRQILLLGIGASYKSENELELYLNYSQNYRAINFNDMQVINSNIVIDPNLSDERGCNIDIGFRGSTMEGLNFDFSLFYLNYKDRIGYLSKYYNAQDAPSIPLMYTAYRLSTNIGDSRTFGVESYIAYDIIASEKSNQTLNLFVNASYQQGHYINSEQEYIEGNKVELNPDLNLKLGIQYAYKDLSLAFLSSYTSSQYTDAQNSVEPTTNALFGEIPAYYVSDLSAKYERSFYTVELGVNNLFNHSYFTRRASGYPGPGIIPSDIRNYYLSLQITL